jgi:hypothetical protein
MQKLAKKLTAPLTPTARKKAQAGRKAPASTQGNALRDPLNPARTEHLFFP